MVCHRVFFVCVAFYEVLIEFFGDSCCYQHKRQLLVVKEVSEGLRIPWDPPWAARGAAVKSDWLTQGSGCQSASCAGGTGVRKPDAHCSDVCGVLSISS